MFNFERRLPLTKRVPATCALSLLGRFCNCWRWNAINEGSATFSGKFRVDLRRLEQPRELLLENDDGVLDTVCADDGVWEGVSARSQVRNDGGDIAGAQSAGISFYIIKRLSDAECAVTSIHEAGDLSSRRVNALDVSEGDVQIGNFGGASLGDGSRDVGDVSICAWCKCTKALQPCVDTRDDGLVRWGRGDASEADRIQANKIRRCHNVCQRCLTLRRDMLC